MNSAPNKTNTLCTVDMSIKNATKTQPISKVNVKTLSISLETPCFFFVTRIKRKLKRINNTNLIANSIFIFCPSLNKYLVLKILLSI